MSRKIRKYVHKRGQTAVADFQAEAVVEVSRCSKRFGDWMLTAETHEDFSQEEG